MSFNKMKEAFKKENLPSGEYKKYLGRIFTAVISIAVAVVFFITLSNELSVSSGDALDIGDGFLAEEKYVSAEQVYLTLTVDGELTPTAKERLINLYTVWANDYIREDKTPEEILAVLEKLLSFTPEDTEVMYVMASLSRKAGNTERAAELCEKILLLSPEDDRAIRYYADLLIENGNRSEAAAYYEEKYAALGKEEYHSLAESLYPTAPVFSAEGGTFDEYFTLKIDYIPGAYAETAADLITGEDVTLLFTVDGSMPDPSVTAATFINQTEIKTFIYSGGIDMQYYYNGSTLTVTAIAVDKYGMVSEPVSAEYTFNVTYRPVKSIKLSKSSVKLEENEQTALRVEISPSNATNQNIVWTSSNTNFATVDQNGFVRAVNYTDSEDVDIRTKEYAKVYITATSVGDGISATCEVTVIPSKIPASTAYHYTKKYLTIDLAPYKEQNPDVVGYIKMDPVDKVPFLPDGLILRSETDDGYYLDHSFDRVEDVYGEITLPAGVNFTSIGRNTVVISNYVDVPLPETEQTPSIDESGASVEEKPEVNTLLTGVATLDKYPSWYLDGKNHYVYLNTLECAYIFQTFSWYHPDGSFNDYMKTDFESLNEFISFCENAEEANQLYNTASPAFSEEDHILTLVIYRNGEVDTVMHGRIARYKSLTGTAPFIDDGLAPSVPTVTPPENEPAEEEPLPENPEQGEEPTQPETPEVSPDEEPEQGEGTAPEQGEDTPSDGGDVPEDGGSGIEGDLNGDGYLSVFEEYQLAIKNGEPLDIPTYEDEESEEDLTEGEAEEGDME